MSNSITPTDGTTYERPFSAPSNTPSNPEGKDPTDAELREVIDAWPSLPEVVRAGIAAMVGAVRP